MTFARRFRPLWLLTASLLLATAGLAQEQLIRQNLAQRLPQFPDIDEVRPSAMPGLYEVRVNDSEIFYTDAQGNYLIQGLMIDTKTRRNLTEERIDKFNAVNFQELPLADAITIVRGDGKRKLAVFEDPNCGYCKQFERDLQKLNNITVYLFLYPILAPSSADKSRNVWCAKDRGRAWQDLMVRDLPTAAAAAGCDASAVLQRNLGFGRKHKITGTPTLIFADNSRKPGAIPGAELERILAGIKN